MEMLNWGRELERILNSAVQEDEREQRRPYCRYRDSVCTWKVRLVSLLLSQVW